MKFSKWLFTLLIFMFSFAVFSFTSEPKQKSEITIVKDFVKTQSFSTVKNVKECTFKDVTVDYNFIVKASAKTTEKYIFDVGWQKITIYSNLYNKESVKITEKYIFDVGWQKITILNKIKKDTASTLNYSKKEESRICNDC